MKLSSIATFDFEKYAYLELNKENLALVRSKATWLLPQSLAFIAGDSFILVRENTKISMRRTILEWVDRAKSRKILLDGMPITYEYLRGMLRILNRAPRGEILGSKMTQSKLEWSRYSAAVPLILSAFKEYRNVPYSDWDYDEEYIVYFMDKHWIDIMKYYPYECPFSKEELLKINEEDPSAKPLISRTTINRTNNKEFEKLPRYLKTMLCQVWVWNPSVRHRYAITNLENLDEPATPLISSEIFESTNEWKI